MEKKKYRRRVIGSVLRSKDNPKDMYIKLREDVVLKAGEIVRLESKKQQLESLEAAVAAGKIGEEFAASRRAAIERIPDFVVSELIKLNQG